MPETPQTTHFTRTGQRESSTQTQSIRRNIRQHGENCRSPNISDVPFSYSATGTIYRQWVNGTLGTEKEKIVASFFLGMVLGYIMMLTKGSPEITNDTRLAIGKFAEAVTQNQWTLVLKEVIREIFVQWKKTASRFTKTNIRVLIDAIVNAYIEVAERLSWAIPEEIRAFEGI